MVVIGLFICIYNRNLEYAKVSHFLVQLTTEIKGTFFYKF
jgi:hypothetical protein